MIIYIYSSFSSEFYSFGCVVFSIIKKFIKMSSGVDIISEWLGGGGGQ